MKLNWNRMITPAIVSTARAAVRPKNNLAKPWILLVSLMGISALTTTPAFSQVSGCNLSTVNGNYGVLASGSLLGAGPAVAVGVLSVNGPGRFVYRLIQNIAGTVSSGSVRGTYTLNPDCTGTATFENGQVFEAVVVDGGNEINLISTVPAALIQTVVAKRTP